MPPRRKKPQRRPLSLILYGPSGSGKTSLAAQFPNCGFIIHSQEQGIYYLSQRDLVPAPHWIEEFPVDSDQSWNQFIKRITQAASDNSIQTLVLESLTGFETMAFRSHCREKFHGNWDGTREGGGFFDFAKGPKQCGKLELPKFLTAMNTVLASGKHVILTAHSDTKEDTNPEGITVLKHIPFCDKNTWAYLHAWASAVFFLNSSIEENKATKSLRKIARPEIHRFLYVEGTPTCTAKNWLGLHGVISMGNSGQEAYANLMEQLR